MIRLLFFAALPPLLIAIVWDDAPRAAIWAGWAVGAGMLAFAWWRGGLVLKCPQCFKRVKLGAQVCHHCGATVTNTSAPGYRHDPMSVSRECPHCKSGIRPDASVCATCRREVEPWNLHEGTWWQRDEAGNPVRLDLRSLTWGPPSSDPAPSAPSTPSWWR